VLDGSINGEGFRLYVERMPVLTLRARAVVVLDNLGSHKQVCLRRQIR
jgi:peroxiredoxin